MDDAENFCADCRKRQFYFERVYSACIYDGALKELIHLFKYKAKISLAPVLSGLMIDFIKDNRETIDNIDTVAFVPLQDSRLRERGFNQSRILAFSISKEFGIPISDLLRKTARTKHQNELMRDERLSNLTGAFSVRKSPGNPGNLNVLLIDDVMTTGTTLNECAKVLRESGVKAVRCLTLARGI